MESDTGYRTTGSRRIADLGVALGFVALAFVVRLPSLVLPSLDWDEGLYLTVAADLNAGHLPYAGLWDRKPVGIFVVFALVERAFEDGVLGVRLLATLFAALGAFALYRIAIALFRPGTTIGIATAIAYLLFSGENSGLAGNTEAFFIPLTLVGFALALGNPPGSPGWPADLAAGLALGLAFQIKFVVLFDLAALSLALVMLAGAPDRAFLQRIRETLPRVVAIAIGFAAPSLAVFVWYAAAGELGAWLGANISANLGYFDRPFGSFAVPLFAAINYGPLCVGAGLALLFGRRLAASARERRGLLVGAVWIAAVLVGLFLLRRWYEHYFIQLLPPLCLLTGFVVVRAVLDVARDRVAYLCAASLLIAGAFFAANRTAYLAAGDLVLQRHARADWAAGDTPRIVARDIEQQLRKGDTVFVFDHDPVIYYLARAAAPTRYPFPGHWFDGADGLFDPLAELEQVLARKPRFIVTRLDSFAPSGDTETVAGSAADEYQRYRLVKERLLGAIRTSYDLVDSHAPIDLWGGRVLGVKPWGANVYRRRDD